MLVKYYNLHLHVFPLKVIGNFLLTSAEILELWRKLRKKCLIANILRIKSDILVF